MVEAPLIYLSGPRDSERYLVERPSTVPGFYPVDTRIVLQFRRGRSPAGAATGRCGRTGSDPVRREGGLGRDRAP